MKTDTQLLKIYEDKEKSFNDYWAYERLTNEEKIIIFDLIVNRGVKK